MAAFAAMDVAAFGAGLAEDVVGFEIDLDGRPVRLGTREEAVRFAEEMFAAARGMGATLHLDFHAVGCRATTALAYCSVEFDFVATMPDGSVMLQPSRNSVVLLRIDGSWQWASWHSSLAVAPAGTTAAAPH